MLGRENCRLFYLLCPWKLEGREYGKCTLINMSLATFKLIHHMKPKHEKALHVKQPSCSCSKWAAFLGRLSHFLAAYPFPSLEYVESIPRPETRCSPALMPSLELGFWSWVTEVQDQDPHSSMSPGHKTWGKGMREDGRSLDPALPET